MGVNRRSSGSLKPGEYRRAYYPSGPWIDGRRPPDPPDPSPPPPPKKEKAKKVSGNPDPFNYKIVQAKEAGRFLILKINYPDCTNYEGNKILVFRDLTLIDLVNQRIIDPHFFADSKLVSPIARFVPTDEGWDMAVKLTEVLDAESGTVGAVLPNPEG